jgi:hypothetical protein
LRRRLRVDIRRKNRGETSAGQKDFAELVHCKKTSDDTIYPFEQTGHNL